MWIRAEEALLAERIERRARHAEGRRDAQRAQEELTRNVTDGGPNGNDYFAILRMLVERATWKDRWCARKLPSHWLNQARRELLVEDEISPTWGHWPKQERKRNKKEPPPPPDPRDDPSPFRDV